MTRRLDTLEKGLEVVQELRQPRQDDQYKLKNTVNFLIRETQELKKDVQLKRKVIDNKDREIQKLTTKIQKFIQQRNDDGGLEDMDEEELLLADPMNNMREQFTSNTQSVHSHTGECELPQIMKYPGEPKKSLEFRVKQALSTEERQTCNELWESGAQFFVDYLLQRGD